MIYTYCFCRCLRWPDFIYILLYRRCVTFFVSHSFWQACFCPQQICEFYTCHRKSDYADMPVTWMISILPSHRSRPAQWFLSQPHPHGSPLALPLTSQKDDREGDQKSDPGDTSDSDETFLTIWFVTLMKGKRLIVKQKELMLPPGFNCVPKLQRHQTLISCAPLHSFRVSIIMT